MHKVHGQAILTHILRTPLSSKEAIWNDNPDISNRNRDKKWLVNDDGTS